MLQNHPAGIYITSWYVASNIFPIGLQSLECRNFAFEYIVSPKESSNCSLPNKNVLKNCDFSEISFGNK